MNAKKPESLRVAFRVERRDASHECVAILPDLPANPGRWVCYAHVGQHGECMRAWSAQHTRRATPAEYAPLLAELQRIYAPEARLRVVSRIMRR